jgi:hypothetical protein
MRVEPVTLEGSFVRLEPLALEHHPRLCEIVLRRYMHSAHRGPRDLAVYSILDAEWPAVKSRLERLLHARPANEGA